MRALALALLVVVAAGRLVGATDLPIDGKKLQLKRTAPTGSWSFVAKGAVLFPTIGGPDDPQAEGALIELVPTPGSATSFAIPAGTGKPGWRAKVGRVSELRYDNPTAPSSDSVIRLLQIRQGKQIKIVARSLDGAAFGPETTAMAIRITMGSLRTCARFEGASIRRSDGSIFTATNASADALPDCSDAALGVRPLCGDSAAPTCGGSCFGDDVCAPAGAGDCACTAPCGWTGSTCGGPCPTGETCHTLGSRCGCLPDGATPCGSPGPPTCGGECPDGEVCRSIFTEQPSGPVFGCGCGAPTVCGDFTGGIECGNGSGCGFSRLTLRTTCYPILCSACGEPCGDGGQCSPIDFGSGPSLCTCAVPAPCCDGGLVCPPSQSCLVGGTCGGCQ